MSIKRLPDPEVLTALDENIDAMIVSHNLGHLSRDDAFAVLDDSSIVGWIDGWNDPDFENYTRDAMPGSFEPWLERIPRSHEYFFNRDPDSDTYFGGSGFEHDPPGVTPVIGYFICVVHEDLSFRLRGRSVNPMDWTPVDPVPSMQCRALFLSKCEYSAERGYVFRPNTEVFGIELEYYAGYGRFITSAPQRVRSTLDAQHAFYRSIGVSYGKEFWDAHYQS
jgi:hypothetical protein